MNTKLSESGARVCLAITLVLTGEAAWTSQAQAQTVEIEDLQRKARGGDAVSQAELGRRYHMGEGVERDYALAARWYTRAAQRGQAAAQTNLGLLYTRGLGVEQDHGLAVAWYRRAAD